MSLKQNMVKEVKLTKRAKKDLLKAPHFIVDKFETWVRAVEKLGLEEIRKVPGYRDEPLSGERKGQRSIRLSIYYRAFYTVKKDTVEFVEVQEVNKHEY